MPAARDELLLVDAFEKAQAAMAAANLSQATMAGYREKFSLFVAFTASESESGRPPTIGDFTLASAIEYMKARRYGVTRAGSPRSRSTLAADALTLRAVAKWFTAAGVTRTNRLVRLAIPTAEPDEGRVLHEDELRALFGAADGITTTERRNLAILAVLLDGGMRVSELVALDSADYEPRTGALRIWHPAKRGRHRVTALGRTARELVAAARSTRRSDGPLFQSTGPKGEPMTASAIRSLLVRLSERAGLERVSPHDLRRTGSTHYMVGGMDPDLHRLMFGWSTVGPDARLRYLILSDAERALLISSQSPLDRLGLLRPRPRNGVERVHRAPRRAADWRAQPSSGEAVAWAASRSMSASST